MRRRWLGVLMAVMIGLGSMPIADITVPAEEETDAESSSTDELKTGQCGEHVTYSLDEGTGTLTISGTGNMTEYPYNANYNSEEGTTYPKNDSPFYRNSNIKKVIIESGVTSIGEGVFSFCTSLNAIEIPYSVTLIGDSAFAWCSALEQVQLPGNVTFIGKSAFGACTSLQKINIPDSVKSIGDLAFVRCAFKDIEIPDSVTSIGSFAFEQNHNLEHVTLSKKISVISQGMFEDCAALQKIDIPNGVTTIGISAFSSCDRLSNVTLPDSVKTIEQSAFNDCPALKRIRIPDGISKLDYWTFGKCNLEAIYIPESVTKIDGAFSTEPMPGDTGTGHVYNKDMTIYGKAGSYAETYAKENSIAFVAADGLPGETKKTDDTTPSKEEQNWDFTKDAFRFSNFSHTKSEGQKQGCDSVISSEDKLELWRRANPGNLLYLMQHLSKQGFNGHCYGMSTAAILQKAGKINILGNVNTSYTCLHDVYKNECMSKLCMYQAFQNLDGPRAVKQSFTKMDQAAKIQKLEETVESTQKAGNLVLLSYERWSKHGILAKGCHTVVAYGVEHGQYSSIGGTQLGTTYDSRILLYDSNRSAPDYKDQLRDLYYDKTTGKCEIPAYKDETIKIQYFITDLDTINADDNKESVNNLLDEFLVSATGSVDILTESGSVTYSNGTVTGANKDKVSVYFDDDADTDGNAMAHIILPKTGGHYTVYPKGENIDISILRQNTSAVVTSNKSDNIKFSGDGSVTIDGNEGDFSVSIADNSKKSEDYHTFSVKGSGKGEVILNLNENGVEIDGTAINGATVTEEGAEKKEEKTIKSRAAATQNGIQENSVTPIPTATPLPELSVTPKPTTTPEGTDQPGHPSNRPGRTNRRNDTKTNNNNTRTSRSDARTTDPGTRQTRFADVPSTAYYALAVKWAVNKSITAGTDSTHFSPNEFCSRAQMATFLYRLSGSPSVSGTTPFKDVKKGSYYYKAVLWAAQNDITSGTTATTFEPDKSCTRGQMAMFLYRFKGRPTVRDVKAFNDVNGKEYYATAVNWAYQSGVTAGKKAGVYAPNERCTRGQAVTFLYRYDK